MEEEKEGFSVATSIILVLKALAFQGRERVDRENRDLFMTRHMKIMEWISVALPSSVCF